MNTQKNSLDLSEESKQIQIEEQSEEQIEEKNSINLLLYLLGLLTQHRLGARKTILSKPFDVITLLSLVPFFLGFYDFLNRNQHVKKTLFEKTVPGFNIPTESVHWETFRYFTQTKKDFFHNIEKIHWSPDSLILTKTYDLEQLYEEVFIGSFPNRETTKTTEMSPFLAGETSKRISIKKIFGNNRLYLNSVENSSVFVEKFHFSRPLTKIKTFDQILDSFYLDLDEIPVKLDSFKSYNQQKAQLKDEDLSYQGYSDKKTFLKLNSLGFQEKLWTQFKNQKLPGNLLKNDNVNIFSFYPQKQGSLFGSTKQSFFEKGKKHLAGVYSLKKPIKTNSDLFFEKQISWYLKKAQNTCKVNSLDLFPINDEKNLKGIISDVDQLFMEQGFSFLRRMSGYSYPDMNVKQVNTFLLQRLFSEFPKSFSPFRYLPFGSKKYESNIDLKIFLPANPSFIQNYSFDNKKIPNFAIETGHSTLKDWDQKETLFNEQAIFLNKKNGLDWQTNNHNLRFWLKNYLSPVNPLTDSQQTVLGNPVKAKINFLESKNEPVVPFLTLDEWSKIYNQNKSGIKTTSFLSEFEINGIEIPGVEIFIKKSPYATLNFDLNPRLDYLYSINSLSTKSTNLDILEQAQDNTRVKSISYKKLLSINTPSNNNLVLEKVFFDNWEPVTAQSWLIVSQISFAFVFFNFLKSLITDYFNELIWFIVEVGFSLGVIDDNLKEEIELLTGQRDKGFRIITKPRKKFQDIAGIKTILPEIAEIVWFLRNRGKDFSLSKNFPRGLLLLGPPGTGKTVLVQALAGEAKVPVLTLSGSSLLAPGESGALKLEMLFQEARQIAPCIVFIDEIDTLAQKRQGVMQNPMGGDEIFSILEPSNTLFDIVHSTGGDFFKNSETSFFKNQENIESLTRKSTQGETKEYIPSKHEQQEKYQDEQLTLLSELLIELDGVQSRQGVIVIGATNRPELLDPAILRPGRFDKILELGLPSYEKRLEIFKLYGDIIGYDSTISWEYFSKRTIGFTAADLASIMNQSTIRAIVNIPKKSPEKPKHTLQTIEHGIDRITTSEIETPNETVRKRFVHRIAYYQAGKILLSLLLEYHPPTLISYLWPRRQNRRSLQILTNLQKYFFQFARRCEVEQRVIGAYGGKAAEILFLQKSPAKLSSFGLEDLSFAFVLACFTIEKWYLYSKSTIIAALTQLISDKNSYELSPEKIEFFKDVAFSMELPPHLFSAHENDIENYPFAQNFFSGAWWQFQISQEFEFVQRHFADWYRLYIPNPEEKELNIDWSPPDEFYHRNRVIKYLTQNTLITWNDLYGIIRDYQVHSFVLQSFNKALCILDENRENLDKLVFALIKREVLRDSEIEQITSLFNTASKIDISQSTKENTSDIRIVSNSFGKVSRRKVKNWIDFADFFPIQEPIQEPTQEPIQEPIQEIE